MGWEFGRKTGPSENVMIPGSTDPFEAPKWATPVLHMPPKSGLSERSCGGVVIREAGA
jgi:hypothetical protein